MSDERLRLSIPDDQVCETCQAVVMNMDTHRAHHVNYSQFVQQRAQGLDRHITALREQAADLIRTEQTNRDTAVDGLQTSIDRIDARIDGLNRMEGGRARHISAGSELADGLYRVQSGRVTEQVIDLLTDLAECPDCYWSKRELTLCGPHSATVGDKWKEAHGE